MYIQLIFPISIFDKCEYIDYIIFKIPARGNRIQINTE